ncbi:MAG TPA: NADH-quinone oxidoreductase subunit C [Acidiferrobacteraceae bacterium]|nr:NADH-quinone oxidoreductase subunit C [Acidiferrobacteraceae bacterium]HEX20516.1 NADH-quinone oxidoreductase subunit C [Acidiferrobacteraceae bacterium]
MTNELQSLAAIIEESIGDAITNVIYSTDELTIEFKREDTIRVCETLHDDTRLSFEQLIDVCGVDYLSYGEESPRDLKRPARFAVVYHLLSIKHNRRLRLRTYLDDDFPLVSSVIDVWNSADWYEREAFDMFGIIFEGHPDLRRILTDYGFIGHPFRKDFPLIGHVEMRYDTEQKRVVYQPVSIEPRILVPRVIREEGFGGRDS